jgi:peptidyl-prolyl cis-trans isomerase SurA
MAHITILLIFNLCLAIHSLADLQKKTSLSQNSKFVDSVVASVNGKPIMFSDIARHNKLEAHDQQTFKHLINDSKFRKALEDEIADQLIRAEAESKKITINASEVDSYLNQVAQRNNLSREDFEKTLKTQGASLDAYRSKIEIEILKSKLVFQIIQSQITVSDEEINNFLRDNQASNSTSSKKIQLAHIRVLKLLDSTNAKLKINQAASSIEDGMDFSEAAKLFSDAADAIDGGNIGKVVETDLSSTIFDVVSSLQKNEVSKVVETDEAFFIFKVLNRPKDDEEQEESPVNQLNQSEREEIRKKIYAAKLEEKYTRYFTVDLAKSYPVERRF